MAPIRVLVVDEDPEVLELTATFLEHQDEDLEILTEERARDALERIDRDDIDAVVSDLRMPDIDGVELAERVRAGRDVPFFLFTGADADVTDGVDVTGVIQKGTGTGHYERLASEIRAAVEE